MMRVRVGCGRRGWLLASSSLVALLIGGGVPSAYAACVNGGGGYNNPSGTTVAGICVTNTNFSGNITNEGTIGSSGVSLTNHATISGHIQSTGVIQGGITIDSTSRLLSITPVAISIFSPTFSGGISNAGTVSAFNTAIKIESVSTFSGGINNTGKIIAGRENGIDIFVSNFSGGIVNAGSLSATNGAIILDATTFSGGISNSGHITSTHFGIAIEGGTFSGNLSNSGTISTGQEAMGASALGLLDGSIVNSNNLFGDVLNIIAIEHIGEISGGITNSGNIVATGAGVRGIQVTVVSQFGSSSGGGITNSGKISADTGIYIAGVSTFIGNISNSGTISGGANGIELIGVNVNGAIVDTGRILASSVGISLDGTTTITTSHTAIVVAGPTLTGGIVNAGTISAGAYGIFVGGTTGHGAANVSSFSGNLSNTGTISARTAVAISGATIQGSIVDSGIILASSHGIAIDSASKINSTNTAVAISGATFTGGIVNAGMISGVAAGISISGVTSFGGNVSNVGTITGANGIVVGAGVTFAAGAAIVNSGTIAGTTAAIDASAASTAVTIDQRGGLITGAIKLSAHADVLNIFGGTINGSIVGSGSSDTINFALGAGTFTYGAAYSFTGVNQVNVNSGTIILDGANSATHVTVNGGTLEVGDASNTGATLTSSNTIDVFGTLAGHGTVDADVAIENGGTLAPGGSIGTLTVNGNISFAAGGNYGIQITPTQSSKTLVNGSATLGGATVVVNAALGTYGPQSYTILTTITALGAGNTFNPVVTTTHGTLLDPVVTYDADDVFLSIGGLTSTLALPATAPVNPQNVADAINNVISTGAALPSEFQNLGNLSGANLISRLTQLDGEVQADAEKGAFQMMNQFLDLMLDPTAGGGGSMSGDGANGFAPEQDTSLPSDVALAYAKALKQTSPSAVQAATSFNRRWSAWGSAFGGTGTTKGDPLIGSSNVAASDYGFAAGMDYHATPNTVYGFGLAGGGTNWNLAQGLGNGRSDAFQAGLYAKTHMGPAYLSGALAFANHWFTASRNAFGDELSAKFTGQSYAARLEGGYRYAAPITGVIVGVTPYAALQAQDFHTPRYSETDLTGGGFGLSYASMNATDTRSELGARFDNLQIVDGMPLVLRGRLAWAHDWVSTPWLGAVFEALPGSNFTVNGAAPPKNSALTTAAAELHITANWTAVAKFDGEFGSGSQTYGGTGALRYTW